MWLLTPNNAWAKLQSSCIYIYNQSHVEDYSYHINWIMELSIYHKITDGWGATLELYDSLIHVYTYLLL